MSLASTPAAVVTEKDEKDDVIVWKEQSPVSNLQSPSEQKDCTFQESESMPAKVRNGEAAEMQQAATAEMKTEVVSETCECCGLTEECTPPYVAGVRERYSGRWVCGLCGEAVEDEMGRAGRRITTEEALRRHMSFSERSRAAVPPVETAEQFISAVRQLLRRSLDSPRATRSNTSSPRQKSVSEGARAAAARRSLGRSGSCFSALAQ